MITCVCDCILPSVWCVYVQVDIDALVIGLVSTKCKAHDKKKSDSYKEIQGFLGEKPPKELIWRPLLRQIGKLNGHNTSPVSAFTQQQLVTARREALAKSTPTAGMLVFVLYVCCDERIYIYIYNVYIHDMLGIVLCASL